MLKSRITILLCILMTGMIPLGAQISQPTTSGGAKFLLEEGVGLYGKSDFKGALQSFRRIVTDPKAESLLPETFYFTTLSYMGIGDYENALKTVEIFLKSYPDSQRMPDMRYQFGRVLFLKKDYENAVKAFKVFIDAYPNHEMYPSSVYWAAESLFQLGHIEEAEKLFRLVSEKYPRSVKYEAAQFRLSLIDFKYREDEILKLLQWSHEESLKAVEEFQRREKTYEQAVVALQKKVQDLQAGKIPLQDAKAGDVDARIAELQKTIGDRDKTIEMLKASGSKDRSGAVSSGPGVPKALEGLLAIKAEALELKEYYLDWLLANSLTGGK